MKEYICKEDTRRGMIDVLKILLIALACPLALPIALAEMEEG